MPGQAAVHRNFHAAHGSSACIRRLADDRDDGARLHGRARRGGRDRGGRGSPVAGRGRGCQRALQRGRLRAHVGQKVDCGLLQVNVRRGGSAVVRSVQRPRPLCRSGSKHQRRGAAVDVAVHRCVMGRRACAEGRTVVEQVGTVGTEGVCGGGKMKGPSRAEPVFLVCVPLVP